MYIFVSSRSAPGRKVGSDSMRRIITCAIAALLVCSALFVPVSAAGKYICEADFEKQKVGKANTHDGVNMVPLDAELNIVEVDGNKVLEYRRAANDGNTAAYTDILTGSKAFAAVHTIQYDLMIPKYLSSAGSRQFATSRQTPNGKTVFQSTAGLALTDGKVTHNGAELAKLEEGKWYTVAAVFHEDKSFFDVYIDGRLVVDAAPYSIDTTNKYPERLRIGQSASAGECLVYVDNIKVYNAGVPENVIAPEIHILSSGELTEEGGVSADFAIPQWTKQYNINTMIMVAMGSVSILLVSVFAVVILKRGKSAQ